MNIGCIFCSKTHIRFQISKLLNIAREWLAGLLAAEFAGYEAGDETYVSYQG